MNKDKLVSFLLFQGIILEVIIVALIAMHYLLARETCCGNIL